jgi:processive 1,2-diacylglycerol beta-glucosyltransferase
MKMLILHASAGAGHRRAAEALARGVAGVDPTAEAAVRDVLDFTPPLFRESYASGYLRLVRAVPELWGYMYARSDRHAREPWRARVRAAFNKINAVKFLKYLDDFAPDAVVCTHFMPLEILSSRARGRGVAIPFFGVVTDFAVHALWIVKGVGCYYVATDEARRHLARAGQPADGVRVTGIPIEPAFAARRPVAEAKAAMGMSPDRPLVLALSGGQGVGAVAELIRAFGPGDAGCQIVTVAGANEGLRAACAKAAGETRTPVRALGHVSNMHEWMDAADLVVTKSGGLTASEALAKGKPMLITDPIPGQEQRNCEYLLEEGVAARLYEAADAPDRILALLRDAPRLARMRRAAQGLGRPHAAQEIARDILATVGRMTTATLCKV